MVGDWAVVVGSGRMVIRPYGGEGRPYKNDYLRVKEGGEPRLKKGAG